MKENPFRYGLKENSNQGQAESETKRHFVVAAHNNPNNPHILLAEILVSKDYGLILEEDNYQPEIRKYQPQTRILAEDRRTEKLFHRINNSNEMVAIRKAINGNYWKFSKWLDMRYPWDSHYETEQKKRLNSLYQEVETHKNATPPEKQNDELKMLVSNVVEEQLRKYQEQKRYTYHRRRFY